jgi:hypothetical protein
MTAEMSARTTGKKKAVAKPTPSTKAPMKAFAKIAIEELKRLNLLTAQAVETPGT